MDISPDHLAHAGEIASRSRLAEQVSFQEGDLNNLPFGADAFDWAWSADSLWPGPKQIGCAAEDPQPLVSESPHSKLWGDSLYLACRRMLERAE